MTRPSQLLAAANLLADALHDVGPLEGVTLARDDSGRIEVGGTARWETIRRIQAALVMIEPAAVTPRTSDDPRDAHLNR